MAAGPLPLGIAAFAAVKLAGYTLAGRTLNRANHVTRPRPLAFGAARTLLGIIAGVSYAMILARFGVHRSEVWYYVNLFPVRQLEWLLTLAHLWRIAAEGVHLLTSPLWVGITVGAGALSVWAWRLLRQSRPT